MRTNTIVALLLGAAIVMGGTAMAIAQMDGPPPPDGPMQGLMHRDRLSDRLLSEFDVNHDGKISHAEFNNVLGSRFASATHGAKLMTADQFLAMHMPDFQKHVAEMFHRIDWNGDGRLTLDEFAAPQRAHFEMLDREGSGTVSCKPERRAGGRASAPSTSAYGSRGRRQGGQGTGGFGLARFCDENDLSRDGQVTRAEFERVVAKDFGAASNGATVMTLAQFAAYEAQRYRDTNARMFKRLDKDGDGKLSLAEFAATSERLFARLDRNHDGTITADEMKPQTHGGRSRNARYEPPQEGTD